MTHNTAYIMGNGNTFAIADALVTTLREARTQIERDAQSCSTEDAENKIRRMTTLQIIDAAITAATKALLQSKEDAHDSETIF